MEAIAMRLARGIVLAFLLSSAAAGQVATAPPATDTATQSAPATARRSRVAVPDEAQVNLAVKTLRDVYRDDYAKRQPEAMRELAVKLIQNARADTISDADRYALLTEACRVGVEAGDSEQAMTATEVLVAYFDTPPWPLRIKTAKDLVGTARHPMAASYLAERVLLLVITGVETEEFDACLELLPFAAAGAMRSTDRSLTDEVREYRQWVNVVKRASTTIKPAQEKLLADPGDAQACLEVGKYEALVKGAWARALPLLAKGNDEPLRELALRDLARPQEPASQIKLADDWWELAGAYRGMEWLNVIRRSRYWYQKAAPFVEGLNAQKAAKRLADADGFLDKASAPHYPRLLQARATVIQHAPSGFGPNPHMTAAVDDLSFRINRGGTWGANGLVCIELADVRNLTLVIDHLNCVQQADAGFFGYLIDYHTPAGYVRRVAFDMRGKAASPRELPWGKKGNADLVVPVTHEAWRYVDLRRYAPPGWDHRIIFTAMMGIYGVKTDRWEGRLVVPGLGNDAVSH